MRIVAIRERTVPLSRYADPTLPSGGLDTSIVAVVTDVVRNGKPVTGYGFASFGRFAQGGLIRERFAPRLLAAPPSELATAGGANLDPFRCWEVMMLPEKPGGHGERCVAVGALDMALWDAAAKIAGLPLFRFLAQRMGRDLPPDPGVPVYAGGGYYYPHNDGARLMDELRRLMDLGFTRAKIKVGGVPLAADRKRIDAALSVLPEAGVLAVDAMNVYDRGRCLEATSALASYGLWWFEDLCDPLDFDTHAAAAASYPAPIAAGEALFSEAEARLLDRHGGLRRNRDFLLFDPVHCYGLPGYMRILEHLEGRGWSRTAFWPHGGHLFALHVATALGLGGAEVNPFAFPPFGGLADGAQPVGGRCAPPDAPGIGLETKANLLRVLATLHR